MNNLEIDDVMALYLRCKDAEIMDKCFWMGLNGIDYKNKEKSGTDYFRKYLDEMENRNEAQSIRDELMEKYKVKSFPKHLIDI